MFSASRAGHTAFAELQTALSDAGFATRRVVFNAGAKAIRPGGVVVFEPTVYPALRKRSVS